MKAGADNVKRCTAGILMRDGKVLLGKRSDLRSFYPDVWDVPGGHNEEGEPAEEALARELMEEIGVVPTEFTRLSVLAEINPQANDTFRYDIFLVTDWTGEPENLTDEHTALRWFDPGEAALLRLAHPEYPNMFAALGAGRHSDGA
ncbi:MAG: NUDIX domain-containing protein [Thermoplasmata archaeon]|nr:NUDIX domain-containing protein [Thermoplasmata archaeon]